MKVLQDLKRADTNRQIDSLVASKIIQQNYILVKIIKANHDIFPECIIHNFHQAISIATFPTMLKMQRSKAPNIDKGNFR